MVRRGRGPVGRQCHGRSGARPGRTGIPQRLDRSRTDGLGAFALLLSSLPSAVPDLRYVPPSQTLQVEVGIVINGKNIMVVLPAYNAAKTLGATLAEIPPGVVDQFLLVDDASQDNTVEVARQHGIPSLVHPVNRGYGGNQKTCYAEALRRGADIVIMLHPDYQYSPKLIGAMAWLVASDEFDAVLGSRILGTEGALKGGMPLYKFVANRILTLTENILLGTKLSEYHTGYRAFSRKVLETLPLEENSDDFVFDNQMLAQAAAFGFRIGEISCPAKYFPEASSINFRRSMVYGLGVLATAVSYRLHHWGVRRSRLFEPHGRRLPTAS